MTFDPPSFGQLVAKAVLWLSLAVAFGGPLARAERRTTSAPLPDPQVSYKIRGKYRKEGGRSRTSILLGGWGRTFLLFVTALLLTVAGPLLPLAALWLSWLNGGSGVMQTGGLDALLFVVMVGGLVGVVVSAVWELVLLRQAVQVQ